MLINVALEKNFSFLQKLRDIHTDSISSHGKMDLSVDPPVQIETQSEDKDGYFESIENNLKKVETALSKKIGFTNADAQYVKPKERVQKPLRSDAVKNKLIILKGEFSAFADKLKSENYRLTDGSKNENHTFIPAEKGLFKKIITGLEQLAELY